MQTKLHVKKGDIVRVVAGNDRGKQGKVLRVYPSRQRVIVEGVNMRIRHMRPSQAFPQGGRIDREMPIHVSNVMPLDSNGEPTRVGRKAIADTELGKMRWVRFARTTGEELDN
jgi:large subunit ribosomal protein L24